MAKKRKKTGDSAVNTEGWMMSYADMATILLAMFITLSTLGKDQTGISLYNGTGSFRNALDCFGMPGLFGHSAKPIQAEAPNPSYQMQNPDGEPDPKNGGPDKDGPGGRVIDAEEEQLQRFLSEMDRQFPIEKLPRVAGQAIVDFFEPFPKQPPYLGGKPREVLAQVLPLLRQPKYRVVLVVWATMPSPGAWTRAAQQAKKVADEIVGSYNLEEPSRARLIALGQPWRYPYFRRPVMSLIIAKMKSAD